MRLEEEMQTNIEHVAMIGGIEEVERLRRFAEKRNVDPEVVAAAAIADFYRKREQMRDQSVAMAHHLAAALHATEANEAAREEVWRLYEAGDPASMLRAAGLREVRCDGT
jgi:predicted transcriptional regulator